MQNANYPHPRLSGSPASTQLTLAHCWLGFQVPVPSLRPESPKWDLAALSSKKAWWGRGLGKGHCGAARLIWAGAGLKGGASHPVGPAHATPTLGLSLQKNLVPTFSRPG